MFVQGQKPCFVVPGTLHRQFREFLHGLGYKAHTGPRTTRQGEIHAWVMPIGFGRQIHVQEELLSSGNVAIYAHTEPAGYGPSHLVSAVRDKASFQGGSRRLRNDIRSACSELKFEFKHFGPVYKSHKSSASCAPKKSLTSKTLSRKQARS